MSGEFGSSFQFGPLLSEVTTCHPQGLQFDPFQQTADSSLRSE
jgi:hypothetical protein